MALSSENAGAGGDVPVIQPEIVNKIAEAAHPTYDIAHDDVIEVVDQQGRIREIFENADTVGWERMLAAVQDLVGHAG